MLQSYVSMDGVRALIVLIFALSQAVMAYWPDLRDWEQTTTSRSQKLDNWLVPFGPFFAIWLLIFASCLGFAAWHALPGSLNDALLRQLGWLAALLFFSNTLWEYYVPRFGFRWESVGIVLVEIIVVLAIFWRLNQAESYQVGADFWLGAAPLYFYGGWISVASFTNLASTLVLSNSVFDPRRFGIAWLMLSVAAGGAITTAVLTQSWIYAASAAWGFAGIGVRAWREEGGKAIAFPAACIASGVLAIGLLSTALN